jgi:ribosomal protein S18 acetylase RimI-like enzyme
MQRKDSSRIAFCDYDPENPQHREHFGALNREWLTRYFFVEPQDEAAFADPESTVLDGGGVILMALCDGVIVGTGSLLRHRDGTCEIAKMAVTEAAQGSGIGSELLALLMDRARDMGAAKLFIVSNTALQRAIRLYRRHGFVDSSENRHGHYARGNITLEYTML